MGAFDDAKKEFAPARPEYGPPKPKETPQPLGLGRAMQFNGVVGRASLPIATTLTNPNHQPIILNLKSSSWTFR